MKKTLLFLYFFVCAMLLFSVTAFAYIDPSAMTYIIQIIAGVAIAAGAAFGFYWRKIKRGFSKLSHKDDRLDAWDEDEEDDDDTGFADYGLSADDLYEDEAAAAPAPTASAPTVQNSPAAYADDTFTVPADKYDERGCSDLEQENLALRRALAQEREKVEILCRALAICSERKA